jgi:hypothetical protein
MVVKSPLKFKNTYGDLRSCKSSDETLEKRLEICPQKGVGSSYAFGRFLSRDIALGRLFCGCTSRRLSSVLRRVFTLDRLLLPEKRILNIF